VVKRGEKNVAHPEVRRTSLFAIWSRGKNKKVHGREAPSPKDGGKSVAKSTRYEKREKKKGKAGPTRA